MSTLAARLRQSEFEARIFVSLGIALSVSLPSLLFFKQAPSLLVLIGGAAGLNEATSISTGYGIVAGFLALSSLLRMWAGSVLTAERVMAFKVQVDKLNTLGPYRIVRNPIYLADFGAVAALALCLPWVGLLMPLLFYFHYTRIIQYEEVSLLARYGDEFVHYISEVPRLFPSPRRIAALSQALKEFQLTPNGFRHNALFVLFVPGMIVAAVTQNFLYGLVIGLPGIIDWAIIHTVIGIRKQPTELHDETIKSL